MKRITDVQKENQSCASCGGRLEQINEYTYRCMSCGQEYYYSGEKNKKIKVRFKMSTAIVAVTVCFIVVVVGFLLIYQIYTQRLVNEASKFCAPVRDFLMEAYDEQILDIDEKDLAKLKYLKIERENGKYVFTYSFEDCYAYEDVESFEKTLKRVAVSSKTEAYSPSNIQYFSGLTRLELYADAWQNYKLPEENMLRSIYCKNGYSKYGTPTFFDNVNPQTLEEVYIYDAEELTDYSFMEHLQGIKSYTLEGATLSDADIFEGLNNLEHVSLKYVELTEEDMIALVNGLLAKPSFKSLYLEGRCAWYFSEQEWSELQEQYKDRVTLERK